MTLEERLGRLATRTPPGDAADVMSAARARAEQAFRRPPRSHWLLAATAAVTAVLAAGALLLLTDGTSDDTVTVAGPDVPVPSGAQVSVVAQYDLDLTGASLVEDSPHTASNSDVVLWSDGNGAYLSLTVRPGRSGSWATPGAGATVRDETFPEGQGEAWFSEPEDPSAATMWWVRPSGDLWLSNGYWYGDSAPESPEAALRTWALGIVHDPSANPSYRAEGVGLTMVSSEDAGDRPSRSRVWEYGGEEVVLLVNERSSAAGPSNLLARGAPLITEVPGLGEVWRVGTTYGWAVAGEDAWATLIVPDALAERAPEILAALRPAGG